MIIVMCDPTKNTTKVTYVDISLHYTCYLSCIWAWWSTDSIQYTQPKPMNENISCVLTDVHLSFSSTLLIVVRMQQGWTALQLWQWVVNFTTRPFYCQGRRPLYQMNRWMDGSQSQSGHLGGAESLVPAGIWTLDHLSYSLISGLTSWERDSDIKLDRK